MLRSRAEVRLEVSLSVFHTNLTNLSALKSLDQRIFSQYDAMETDLEETNLKCSWNNYQVVVITHPTVPTQFNLTWPISRANTMLGKKKLGSKMLGTD